MFTLTDDFWVDPLTDLYDVTADGQHFIMARRASGAVDPSSEGIILVQSFFTELSERLAGRN